MTDSDEDWASASDSEIQDTETEHQRADKPHKVTDFTLEDGIEASSNKPDIIAAGNELADGERVERLSKQSADQSASNTIAAKIDCRDESEVNNETSTRSLPEPPPYEESSSEVIKERQLALAELSESNDSLHKSIDKPDTSQPEICTKSEVTASREQVLPPASAGWGGWGSSWLSKAASSVALSAHSLASSTEQGISSIVNSVESSFGIPTPESMADRHAGEKSDSRSAAALDLKELAQRLKEEQNTETLPVSQESTGSAQLESNSHIPKESNDISGEEQTLTTNDQIDNTDKAKLEDTESSGFFGSYGITLTNKIITGGLDTLENLGKKTMDLLSEGDPGLRNKRAFVQEQFEIIRKENEDDIDSDIIVKEKLPVLTSFHSEFEKLQGYVYLEALEILSSECDAKQRLKVHSVSTKRSEEGASSGDMLQDISDINFDSERASCEWGDLFPSCRGIVNLERVQQAVGELEQCSDTFEGLDLSPESLVPQLNCAMQLLAKLSSQYIQTVRKLSELCLAHQAPVRETLAHSRELALIAYKAIDAITVRIALIEVSDDVIGNKFILDMNSGTTYIQDSFSLMQSVLRHASSS